MTITGLDEHLAAVSQLPETVRSVSRAVALKSAQSIRNDAARRLRSQQKTAAHALADGIGIAEDEAQQRFVVSMQAPASQPANLAVWNEYGTVRMPARPSMGPAAQAEAPHYVSEMERVNVAAVTGALGS